MSSENVEIVRRMLDDYANGEFERALGVFSDDVEWEAQGRREVSWPRGVVAEAVHRWTGAWADFEFDVQELIDASESVVMVRPSRTS